MSSDPDGRFDVDEKGAVHLAGKLDREGSDQHTVLVLAVDEGEPQRTATATMVVSSPFEKSY